MAKYPKPKRTVQRGLRSPFPLSAVDFPQKIIEKMGEILERALSNNKELEEKERFVIAHAYKVAQFRQLKEYGKEKDHLLREIDKDEEEALQMGLSVLEVRGINHYVLRKDREGQLNSLLEKLKARRAK